MKNLYHLCLCTFLLLLTATTSAFSQDKNYMNKLAEQACDCLSKSMAEKDVTKQTMTAKVGVCMMEASQPYQAQLKKEYGIDLINAKDMRAEGEKLGKIIGMKMLSRCPDMLVAVSQMEDKGSPATKSFEGEVVAIQDQQFVVFTVKDENGKTNNFLWLTFFQSDPSLTDNYRKILNKQVSITYQEQEFFDPRIKELKKFNVITGLKAE